MIAAEVIHTIVKGSQHPSLQVQLYDQDGPFSLGGSPSVELRYGRSIGDSSNRTAIAGTILTPSEGTVEFDIASTTFDIPGDWIAQVVVTISGEEHIFPSGKAFIIRVEPAILEA